MSITMKRNWESMKLIIDGNEFINNTKEEFLMKGVTNIMKNLYWKLMILRTSQFKNLLLTRILLIIFNKSFIKIFIHSWSTKLPTLYSTSNIPNNFYCILHSIFFSFDQKQFQSCIESERWLIGNYCYASTCIDWLCVVRCGEQHWNSSVSNRNINF